MASLLKNNPKIAKEWHPTRTKHLTPKDVTLGSNKKMWWICTKGHEWQAKVNDRNYRRTGCPYCSGRKVCDDNSLQTLKPALVREWHPVKNGSLTPRDVTPSSYKKVWWTCEKGHEWQATVSNRNRGRGCPYCARRAVCEDNCLQTVDPSLAAEWHPEKNGCLTPTDVTPGSSERVWWRGKNGHEWQAQINSRNQGYGKCPYCRSRRGT